jgi:hypothetical protein
MAKGENQISGSNSYDGTPILLNLSNGIKSPLFSPGFDHIWQTPVVRGHE